MIRIISRYEIEKTLKGSLDSVPSPSVKIEIMGGKVSLRYKGKTLLGVVNKLCVFKSLLTSPSNGLPHYLKKTFPSIIWIFTEGEGDGIKSRLAFKFFSTLTRIQLQKFLNFWPSKLTLRIISSWDTKKIWGLRLVNLWSKTKTSFFFTP